MGVPRARTVALCAVLLCAVAEARQWLDDCVLAPSGESPASANCQFRSLEVSL